jgi:hypothetical protein
MVRPLLYQIIEHEQYQSKVRKLHFLNQIESLNITTDTALSRDSAVGIATGYGLDDREIGVRVPVLSRIFTSPCRLDRLWGPANLLYNGYRGPFPGG